MATLPYVFAKSGKFYGTTVPFFRFVSKSLKKYIPKDPEVEYLAYAYSDMYLDWMTNNDPKTMSDYNSTYCVTQHTKWNDILSDESGPYIFGDKNSYIDFLLFHQLNNHNGAKIDASKYSRLAEFVKVIRARPSLQEHFKKEQKEIDELSKQN